MMGTKTKVSCSPEVFTLLQGLCLLFSYLTIFTFLPVITVFLGPRKGEKGTFLKNMLSYSKVTLQLLQI